MIGPENSRHPLNQSGAKLKTITAWSPAFSRALASLTVLALSSHWLLKVFPLLIGHCDYFGFGIMTQPKNSLFTLIGLENSSQSLIQSDAN